MKKALQLPWHPLLFALYVVLGLMAHNRGEMPDYTAALLPAGLALGLALLLLMFWSALLRDMAKAGLLSLAYLILFFSYGHLYGLLQDATPALARHRYLLALWLLFYVFVTWLVLRLRAKLGGLTRGLNLVALLLILMPLINLTGFELGGKDKIPASPVRALQAPKKIPQPKRDVYYLILDGYPNQGIWEQIFGFDNQPFLNYLRKRGFRVLEHGHSNYASTFLSLSSSLNMTYLDQATAKLGKNSQDRRITHQMILNNRLSAFFRGIGYRVINLSTGWEVTAALPGENFGHGASQEAFHEFMQNFYQATMLRVYLDRPGASLPWSTPDSRRYGAFILDRFHRIAQAAKLPGRKFVFAHILAPHPPYVLDKACRPLATTMEIDGKVYMDKPGFVGQVQCVNQQVERIVNTLLSVKGPKPIIVLQGDHGSLYLASQRKERGLRLASREAVTERMGILDAIYLPGANPPVLPADHTPVNTFRIILNHYFGLKLKPLPNRVYYSNYDYPFDLKDVTAYPKR